jgi:hypothetical protein
MSHQPIFASLTRISDLKEKPFSVQELPRNQWATGDYVMGRVSTHVRYGPNIELANGRMMEIAHGDDLVGALGTRAATLEAVGNWQSIGDDGAMQALTGAGLIGRATSVSALIRPLLDLDYQGHIVRNDKKVTMNDFVKPASGRRYDIPTVLIIGTSMSAGKTTVGKLIVRELSRAGLRVAGVKLTGAGRYRDILAMRDAGAEVIFDFVDGGLPSTVCSASDYRGALSSVLGLLMDASPDVAIVEAGASPLEPYSGDVLIDEIQNEVKFTVLCASDPYAVVGVTQGFGFQPDLVAGIATTTSAAVELVTKLSGIRALNLLDPATHNELCQLLRRKLAM